MRPRTPEGPRFLRSDGTPDKQTRIHTEAKWLDYVKPPEALHSPNATFRVAFLEFLTNNRMNIILADGDKYLGVTTLPKVVGATALWRERDEPVYKILMEPLKRVEERMTPLVDGSNDKEVAEALNKAPPSVDEVPVVKGERVVGVLNVRDVASKEVLDVPVGELAVRLPTVGSVGEALMEMEEKGLPVVAVEDRLLDARDVARRIWEERTLPVGSIKIEDLLIEPYEVYKQNVSLREALENFDPHKEDYLLVDLGEGYGIVPLVKVAAKAIHP